MFLHVFSEQIYSSVVQSFVVLRRKVEARAIFVCHNVWNSLKFSVQISFSPWMDLTETLPSAPLVLQRL